MFHKVKLVLVATVFVMANVSFADFGFRAQPSRGEFKILPVRDALIGTITKSDFISAEHSFLSSWIGGNIVINLENKNIFVTPYCPLNSVCTQALYSYKLTAMSRTDNGSVVYMGSSVEGDAKIAITVAGEQIKIKYSTVSVDESQYAELVTSVLEGETVRVLR